MTTERELYNAAIRMEEIERPAVTSLTLITGEMFGATGISPVGLFDNPKGLAQLAKYGHDEFGFDSCEIFNIWSHVQPMTGKTILDFEDFVFSQFWLPLGALATCVYCCWPIGFGWEGFRDESGAGAGWSLPAVLKPYMRYLLPLVLLGILLGGL